MMIFDGHADLLYDVTKWRQAGEDRVFERRHLPRLQAGQIGGLGLSIWTTVEQDSIWSAHPDWDGWRRTEEMMACAREELAECPWLGLEQYAQWGVRMGMLTWNEENLLACGAGGDPDKGLTALGREAVRRMQRLNILPDVSHTSDRSFWDIMDLAEGPVIASHSNCRALCDVRRNLTDEQLRAIRDTGGVVGVNVSHDFVHKEPRQQSAAMLARHAAHMAEVMGPEHVACGFDFCEYFGPGYEGCEGMEDCGQAQNFFFELERIGFSEAERQAIASENLLQVLE